MSIKKMLGAWLGNDEQDLKQLIIRIEKLRLRMENLVKLKGTFNDPEVLAVSQELDDALNQFHKSLK